MIKFDYTSACAYFFAFGIIFIGGLLGKIKCFRISIGIAGILIIGLLSGFLLSYYNIDIKEEVLSECAVLSDFGMYIFLASIALETGAKISITKKSKYLHAAVLGIITVLCGALITFILSYPLSLEKTVIMGIFAGAMTSTPALAEALRITSCNDITSVYASIYFLSVLLTVCFVKVASDKRTSFKETTYTNKNNSSAVIPLVISVLGGIIIGNVTIFNYSLGSTIAILICGILVGIIYKKMQGKSCNPLDIKKLGLMLFLQGIGLKAGGSTNHFFLPRVILIGITTSLGALILSYFLAVKVFKFSKNDTLSIIAGGMTSSPAIASLNESHGDIDSSLFAFSYLGALFTLLLTIRIFNIII
jgi:AspT/YidE/YbjL antiporter-like protein